ncbi:MAG TPA: DUF3237 family protein [Dehalococcoidia bacterium]|nr:DUF3237 family protein [Dehalococcoidia bacterium]
MRLEFLFDAEFNYQGGFELMRPYGGKEGQGFGAGTGTVEGEKVRGTLQWSNYPRLREDGVLLPDARGRIETEDGAHILFTLQGYAIRRAEGSGRTVIHTMTFKTENERYLWLNLVYAIGEGRVSTGPDPSMRYYTCLPDEQDGREQP